MTNELMLFSVDQVSRLTGLKKGRLGYWHTTDFFRAKHTDEDSRPFGRVYSFLDLVALRTLAVLVNSHKIHLSELRRVSDCLSDAKGDWAGCKFLVGGRRVFWVPRGSSEDDVHGVHPPTQIEMRIAMDEITRDVREAVVAAKQRESQDFGKIERHRTVAENAYVLAGTRIPTRAIWAFHSEGHDSDGIKKQYPRLTSEDIKAAIEFERLRHTAAS